MITELPKDLRPAGRYSPTQVGVILDISHKQVYNLMNMGLLDFVPYKTKRGRYSTGDMIAKCFRRQ